MLRQEDIEYTGVRCNIRTFVLDTRRERKAANYKRSHLKFPQDSSQHIRSIQKTIRTEAALPER